MPLSPLSSGSNEPLNVDLTVEQTHQSMEGTRGKIAGFEFQLLHLLAMYCLEQ